MYLFFFFKQKTAYEMRISDWSSDVCSSDLPQAGRRQVDDAEDERDEQYRGEIAVGRIERDRGERHRPCLVVHPLEQHRLEKAHRLAARAARGDRKSVV